MTDAINSVACCAAVASRFSQIPAIFGAVIGGASQLPNAQAQRLPGAASSAPLQADFVAPSSPLERLCSATLVASSSVLKCELKRVLGGDTEARGEKFGA